MRDRSLSVPSVILMSSCPALPCPALPCPALPCPALPCPALPCPALPCPALPCPALPCPALPCPALPCPALPCPALPCPDICTSNVGQVPEVWAACPDWGLHGHQQLCASGHSGRHGADFWQHLPWGWPCHEQSPVQEEPGIQRGLSRPLPPSHTSCMCIHGHYEL